MIKFLLFLCILLKMVQSQQNQYFNYTEYVQVAPGSYMQLTSMTVPSYNYTVNPGIVTSSLSISIYDHYITSNQAFNMYIFKDSMIDEYPCVVNALMIDSDPQDCYTIDKSITTVNCSTYVSPVNSSKMFDLSILNTSTLFVENCDFNYYQEIVIELYYMKFSGQEQTNYIIIIENTSKYVQDALFGQAPLNLITQYNQTIISSKDYEKYIIGTCIGLGLILMLLISFICIYNFKYQKLKQQNETSQLIRGSEDQGQKKKQKPKQN